jgi:hypothetical protein
MPLVTLDAMEVMKVERLDHNASALIVHREESVTDVDSAYAESFSSDLKTPLVSTTYRRAESCILPAYVHPLPEALGLPAAWLR